MSAQGDHMAAARDAHYEARNRMTLQADHWQARAQAAEARLSRVEALADRPAAARSGTGQPISVVLIGDLRAALGGESA